MAVISIIGCAGVGKSTLVKQLAALNRAPAFFEGEEGVFPEVVTKNLIVADPVARERWFVRQYVASLSRAHDISALGGDVYVDNASSLTIESYANIAPEPPHAELAPLLTELNSIAPHVTVVLTARPETLAAYIAERGRVSEEVISIARQAELVQEQFIALAPQYDAYVFDRTGLNFHNEHDLKVIAERLGSLVAQKSISAMAVTEPLAVAI